ncbi:MAG: hypothetical protein GXY53_02935 [Desulfobulbus sp.]|nr:hypothetical protein [Desulfobulbus sp.]
MTDGNKNSLRCTLCHTVITKQELALSVQGSHEHAFFNPAGIAFEIRCFRAAPGTVLQGGTSDVFSWFSGYHWQVALCAHCRTHLGWRFTGDTVFFGLIAARIR